MDFLLSFPELIPCEFGGEQAAVSLALVEATADWCTGGVIFARLFVLVPCVNPLYSCHV